MTITPIPDTTLDEIIELSERATKGPWQRSGVRQRLDGYPCHIVGPDGAAAAAVFYSDETAADHVASLADADLIALSRNHAADLAREVRALRGGLAEIIRGYDGYRARGVMVAAEEYAAMSLTKSIDEARALIPAEPAGSE